MTARDRYRKKAKEDPNFAREWYLKQQRYRVNKIKRCPEAAALEPLRVEIGKKRVRLDNHLRIAAVLEKKLLALIERYEQLKAFCRGK